MSALSAGERSMSAAWKRGLSRRLWTEMARDVGDVLVSSFDSGRRQYLPAGASSADMTAFFAKARDMSLRAAREVQSRYEAASIRHGDEMVSEIYILFFDEDDENIRLIPRGVPSAVSRTAARMGIPMARARAGLEVLAQDEDLMDLVRTIPRRSVLPALDEVRRAVNLGIADAGMSAGMSSYDPLSPSSAPEGRVYPLWEIREMMDSRTRGNPHGEFPHDGFHWQVSGYISTIDEIVRQGCVPPCGRNCRASLFPVSRQRAETLGLVGVGGAVDFGALRDYNGDRQGYIDRGQYPDPRFR